MEAILANYRESMTIRGYERDTIRKSICYVRALLAHCSIDQLSTATTESHLLKLAKEGRSNKTIANHRSAIKVFCDYLVAHGHLKRNPIGRLPIMKMHEEVPIFLTDDEIDLLERIAAEDDMSCEITLALNTGLRLEELRVLEWADVDFEHRQITVRRAKSKRPRIVPLNGNALKALRRQHAAYAHLAYVFPGGKGAARTKRWTEAKPRGRNWWEKTAIRRMQSEIPSLQKLAEGRTGRGWHALRHTFATRAARAGIDMFKLKNWMGHRKIETTLRYVHVAQNYDADIERI